MQRPAQVAIAALMLLMAGPAVALAQADLPIRAVATATVTDGAPADFRFTAQEAGLLAVAVQGGGDLVLAVTDADGQPLPDGTADRDVDGDLGREYIAVVIPHAGEYRVLVRLRGGEARSSVRVTAAWTAFPDFAREPDPDGRPGLAIPLEVGRTHEDELDSAVGDHWDWFVVRAPSAGSLVVVTRLADGESGDLVLEAFTGGEFAEPAVRSDQDLQGDTGHESVTVRVQAGETVHLRVSSAYGTTSRVRYRISSSILP